MKHLFFVLIFIFTAIICGCKKSEPLEHDNIKLLTQTILGSIRYKNEVFTNAEIKVTKDITYRNLNDFAPGDQKKQALKLDFYEPINDLIKLRPLLIFIHGGGLKGGSKDDLINIELCKYYTRHGFAVASLNYRLDSALNRTMPSQRHAEALYRGTQDARFAVRFMKANSSLTKIDATKIFIGGVSAGALIALHATYINDSEVDRSLVNVSNLGTLNYGGGLTTSSSVRGAFAYAGALVDTNYMQRGDVPAACIHSTGDNLIPIDYGLDGFLKLPMFGGKSIATRLYHLGVSGISFKQYNDPLPIQPVPPSPMIQTHGAGLENSANFAANNQFICDFIYSLL